MAHSMDHPHRPSSTPPILPYFTFHIPPHPLKTQNHFLEPSTSTIPPKRQLFENGLKITPSIPKFTNFAPEITSVTPKITPSPPVLLVLIHFHPFHPLLPLTPSPLIHNTPVRKWVGHLWVYHNFDVDIFKIHPRGEEISRSGNFRFGTMIEFDYLSHHIGTTIYLLGLYVEKWVQSLQWAI